MQQYNKINNLIKKFVVVSGKGLIQLRKIGNDENGNPYPIQNFYVSGEKIEAIEMIPGYTHNIINLSETEDMVTFIAPVRERTREILDDESYLKKVIDMGAEKARKSASATIEKARELEGLKYFWYF